VNPKLQTPMFITDFKRVLAALPAANHADGLDAFMQHISDNENVVQPTKAFLAHITNRALARLNAAPAPAADHNPRILLAAFAMTRFPIETLRTPEEPLQLTLLTKAMNLLLAIDRVLHEHGPDEGKEEDDAASSSPVLLSAEVSALFLRALGEYRSVWAEWWASECDALRARALSAAAALHATSDLLEQQAAAAVTAAGEE
jgi:hypothetical protein